jgi:hypothetical protein
VAGVELTIQQAVGIKEVQLIHPLRPLEPVQAQENQVVPVAYRIETGKGKGQGDGVGLVHIQTFREESVKN